MLRLTHGVVDEHLFYDDRSTDDTAEVAAKYCTVVQRSEFIAPFAMNEGQFREAAWVQMEEQFDLGHGDWILVIDCDEFIGSTADVKNSEPNPESIRDSINYLMFAAVTAPGLSYSGINLNIPEVFAIEDGEPMVRTDRLWGTIHAPRLFPYRVNASYAHGAVGVPAVPSYVQGGNWMTQNQVYLLHYGYADPKDHKIKYERYAGRGGHSNTHVESIIAEDKTLEAWPYAHPQVKS